jgi:lambda family phage portal protein
MNSLDRLIGWASPERAARRLAFRQAIEIKVRSYDAARRDNRTMSWQAGGASANAEIIGAEETVRNRARSLVRDNGYAGQIVETIADHIVGTGIVSAPTGLKGRNRERVGQAYTAWTENCDYDGDQDYNGLLWTATRAMAESGACFIRLRRVEFDSSVSVAPLQLQLLEPDFLDSMKAGTTEVGGIIDRGIEYDAQGRKVAYWLYEHHPGDVAQWRVNRLKSNRVPVGEVIYLYDKLRPGQDRGMSALAPAVMTLRDLDGYFEAELVRKRMEACLAGFITSDDESGFVIGEEDTHLKSGMTKVEKFQPGMITRLRHGEDIKIAQPSNAQGVGEFALLHLREAAAAAGVMYEHATGDFSNVNYSSWRAGHHGFRRRMERKQWHLVIHKACRPIVAGFTASARAADLLPAQSFGWRHTPPGFISVDPVKDAKADLANLEMGKVTLAELVEREGYDYIEHLARFADGLREADAALGEGVMFDGDPRKVRNMGNNSNAGQDPAN